MLKKRACEMQVTWDFFALHRATLQCMSLRNHVTPNFNKTMSTAAVLLDMEKPLTPRGTLACYTSYQN